MQTVFPAAPILAGGWGRVFSPSRVYATRTRRTTTGPMACHAIRSQARRRQGDAMRCDGRKRHYYCLAPCHVVSCLFYHVCLLLALYCLHTLYVRTIRFGDTCDCSVSPSPPKASACLVGTTRDSFSFLTVLLTTLDHYYSITVLPPFLSTSLSTQSGCCGVSSRRRLHHQAQPCPFIRV